MNLRVRFALTVAIVAAAATVFATTVSYRSTSQRLDRAVDESLRDTGNRLAVLMARHGAKLDRYVDDDDVPDEGRSIDAPPPSPGDRRQRPRRDRGPGDELIATQWLDTTGAVTQQPNVTIPVNDEDLRIAAAPSLLVSVRVARIDTSYYRIRTIGVPGEGAVQVARDVSESQLVMRDLLRRFVALVAGTSVVAALAAWLLAGQATRRLQHLERVVTKMATTANLSLPEPLQTTGKDETAKVATAVDHLVRALSASREQQQRLVEDASHELRTPLTSLRTNLAVLPQLDRLPIEDRQRLVADVQSEVEELVHMVDELVEHATANSTGEESEVIGLKDVAESCAVSVRRRTGRVVEVTGDDSCVVAGPIALARVITNLLGNAVKFDSSTKPVVVNVTNGTLTVRDHGPGFAPGDSARVFDRFYRADDARSLPGSGLGLSIVADTIHRLGGSVHASNAPGGGALVQLMLPEHTGAAPSRPEESD
jgi:two-component system, OmpR family, sensor histidine kinase MprB